MPFFKPKRIDLTKKGLGKILGNLEAEILSCIWDHGHKTARGICDCLNTHRKISFNALNTVINRMVDKNILRKKKDNSYYYYEPLKSRKEFAESVNKSVFESLLKDNKFFSVSTFVDFIDSLPVQEKRRIEKYFKDLKK